MIELYVMGEMKFIILKSQSANLHSILVQAPSVFSDTESVCMIPDLRHHYFHHEIHKLIEQSNIRILSDETIRIIIIMKMTYGITVL